MTTGAGGGTFLDVIFFIPAHDVFKVLLFMAGVALFQRHGGAWFQILGIQDTRCGYSGLMGLLWVSWDLCGWSFLLAP